VVADREPVKTAEDGRAEVSNVRKACLAGLLACAATLASCQGTSDPDLFGSWRNWDSGFFIVFSADGTVRYDLDLTSEELWTMLEGTYRVISEDEIDIDIDHEVSGTFRYIIEGDVLQLTNDPGGRMVFRREKGTPERKRLRHLSPIV